MSYYRPSYSQTVAMSRGGRGYSSSRGSSYRGSSRGGSSWGGPRGGGYHGSSRGGGGGRFATFSSFDSRSKYPVSSDRYGGGSRGHHSDEYRKPYKHDSGGYSSRDHRSPERKRMRNESSHERSFGGSGDYNRYESERRSFSNDRRPPQFVRKEEFRKPLPPSSPRGGYRGRASSRGNLRARLRERPVRRRLVETSYAVRRRAMAGGRSSDFARRLKISRLRSSIRRRKEEDSDKEISENDEEVEKKVVKEDEKEESETEETAEGEKKASPKKAPKKEKEEGAVSEKDDKKEESDTEADKKAAFIKLTCPHCLTRCATFGKYGLHLQSGRHATAMRRVALKQKSILSQMRLVQRKAQREVEKTTEDLAPRTSWCPLCKLNYKQPKLTHQASAQHKDMKKFLMPFCKICKITFKSPMIFESHACSIEHIKRKALLTNGDEKDDSAEDDAMENFMTIDSVGDMDEEGGAAEGEKKEGGEQTPKVPKEQINVGIENIRKVEVQYCDLCRMYLPRTEEDEMAKTLQRHCKQRTHLQRYIRFKEDKELARRAERLQRKETAEKQKDKPDKAADKDKAAADKEKTATDEKKVVEKKDEPKTEAKPAKDPNAVEDDKLWADVDNILAEVESGNKSSDEDEEDSVVNGERYDRFKYSEKGDELKKKKETATVVEEEKKMEVDEVEPAKA